MRRGRTMLRTALVGTALTAVVVGGAAPAQARPVLTNSTSHQQLSTGDLRAYDYQAGASTTWDTDAQWATGAYVSTANVPSSGAVTLAAANTATDAWWNNAWRSRRCFTVTNPAGYAVAAHPVQITFASTADIAGGALAAGAADLRVTTGGAAPATLPFDPVGPWPSATSAVWVKVPALAAGASTTACLYYNNPAATAQPANPSARYDPLYRVRTASPAIADPGGNWVPDNPAPAGMSVNTGNFFGTTLVLPLDPSVPSGTPAALFATERWDPNTTPELRYRFTVAAGRPFRVRLLEAEIYFNATGQRVFNVNVEGGPQELTNLDVAAECLARGQPVRCGLAYDYPFATSGDGFVDIDFIHVVENPKVAAIEILDETQLTTAGGAREDLLATSGTWTSPVIDTGGAGVFGLTSASLTTPAGTTVTYQLATSASPSGPWAYVGPDGTAATSYDGAPQPVEYSADGKRYVRARATLTGPGTATPVLGQLTIGHSLPVLARSSGGRAVATTTAGAGVRWAVRIKTTEPTMLGAGARLLVDATSSWGGATLTGAFDGPPLTCCGPIQFAVTAGALTSNAAPAVLIPASGSAQGSLSVVISRGNAGVATADLTLRAGLAASTSVELPLRLVLP
jgi:hypothetical protein